MECLTLIKTLYRTHYTPYTLLGAPDATAGKFPRVPSTHTKKHQVLARSRHPADTRAGVRRLCCFQENDRLLEVIVCVCVSVCVKQHRLCRGPAVDSGPCQGDSLNLSFLLCEAGLVLNPHVAAPLLLWPTRDGRTATVLLGLVCFSHHTGHANGCQVKCPRDPVRGADVQGPWCSQHPALGLLGLTLP